VESSALDAGLAAALRAVSFRSRSLARLLNVERDDVHQEASLACCLAARSFRPPGNFAAYAATAALNRLRLLLRRRPKVIIEQGLPPDLPERDYGPPPPFLRQRLRRLIRRLAPGQQRAMSLHLIGLSNCEVGREMGVNEATVRVHLKRACRRLSLAARRD